MNILLINHYAGSPVHGMEYRPYYMAKEWVKAGYDVTIVAGSFSHVRQVQPSFEGFSKEEVIDGIHYIWIKTPYYSGNGAKRAMNIFAFVARLFLRAGKIAKEMAPDVVIASSTYPLDIFAAKRISKKSGAKLIFEVHDIWPLSPVVLGGMSKAHPFIRVMQLAEDCACRWSEKVVSILPMAKGHLTERGMDSEKFVHIPNGIVLNEWANGGQNIPEEHEKEIARVKGEGRFLVCYAGSHGLANALESFVGSARLLEDPRVHLILVGDGLRKKSLIEFASKRGIKNVSFLPPVPKKAVPALLQKMDVLFFSLQKCELFRHGISPNKLIDYMMAGKPVIQAVNAGNDMAAEAGCGITVEPENENAYAEAMAKLINLTEEERATMGSNGRKYAVEKHDYTRLAKEFLEVLAGRA